MRGLSAFALALVVLVVALPCRAEASGLSLTWSAPPACPDEARVISDVRLLSGSRSTRALAVDAVVDGPRSPSAAWTVVLHARPDDGAPWSRTLQASSCVELASVVSLVLALASERSDVEPVRDTPPAVTAVATEPVTKPESPPESQSPVSPPAPDARRVAVFVSAGALVDVGTLPSANAGVGVGLGLGVRQLRIEASARHHPATQTARDSTGRGGEFSESAIATQACFTWPVGNIAVGPCAGAELIVVEATGIGVALPTARTVVLVGPSGGLAATWRFARHWSIDLGLRGLALVHRPAFALDPSGVVHRPAALVGLSTASMRLDF